MLLVLSSWFCSRGANRRYGCVHLWCSYSCASLVQFQMSCAYLVQFQLVLVWFWSGFGLVLVWFWSGSGLVLVWFWSGSGNRSVSVVVRI